MTIFCIGRNYPEHAKELNNPVPAEPVVFCKPPASILRDNKPFYYPAFSNEIHYEVEILLKIAKPGKSIKLENAHEYMSQIGLGIDFTARDIQQRCKEKGLPWEIAKGWDQSAVIGEWIDVQQIIDLKSISFSLIKNKEIVQRGNSSEMIFSFSKIIVYLSQYFKISTGDIIFTGTPSGVGPVIIGDLLEGFIEDRRMFWTEVR
ncbi:MAG: fumarylacetoacetate hydrolase family protein [Saprospiraceae bacterium]|nr:fumarylacetoacetate hydrolase family protein [Saprospiraceae bacterium]